MCSEGKPIGAQAALAAGLVDRLIDGDLLAGAIAFARERAAAGGSRRTRELPLAAEDLAGGAAAVEAARSSLSKSARGMRAPLAAVDAIEAALTESFDRGSEREREIFASCVVSTESKALRHLFFAEREAAKVP